MICYRFYYLFTFLLPPKFSIASLNPSLRNSQPLFILSHGPIFADFTLLFDICDVVVL